jgi:hypothetical protein
MLIALGPWKYMPVFAPKKKKALIKYAFLATTFSLQLQQFLYFTKKFIFCVGIWGVVIIVIVI